MAAPPRPRPASRGWPECPRAGRITGSCGARRRGGLNATLQQSLFDRLRPILLPGKGKAASSRAPTNWPRCGGQRQPGAARRQAQGGDWASPAEAAAAQPGADLRLLVADPAGGARPALRSAQRRGAPARWSEGWLDAILALRARQRERADGLGVLPDPARPPHRPAGPRRRRQPRGHGADRPGACRCRDTGRAWSRK